MKSTDIIQPTAITQPIAVNGSRNSIPESPAGSNYASIEEGFPDVTMTSPTNGGLPPFGQDFNGLFYLSSDQKVYLQNGGVITYNEDVASAIGGYPQGAILDYVTSDGTCAKVQSLIDDNSNNFVETPSLIDGVNWQLLNYSGALNHSQITDCILNTPDMGIDLSITDGVLTLKAGAKVIIPYGTSAPELSIGDSLSGGTIVDVIYNENEGKLFYIVQYDEDKTNSVSYTYANVYLLMNAAAGIVRFSPSYTTSGSTAPTTFTGGYALWYDTEENYVKITSNSGSSWTAGASFPFGRVQSDADSGYTKVLQVFQASGFIDKTIWLNKGVTFLMPNGRNDDGTLKNIEYTTNQIYTDSLTLSSYGKITYSFTLDHTINDVYYPIAGDTNYYEQTVQPDTTSNCLWYNPETNIFSTYRTTAGGWFEETAAVFAEMGYDTANQYFLSGVLKNTFRAADNNDIDGEWHIVSGDFATLISSVDIPVGESITCDISDYLPKDGRMYEVLFAAMTATESTLGANVDIRISTDWYNAYPYIPICAARCTSTTYSRPYASGSIILPVGSGRSVSLSQGSSSTGAASITFFRMYAYRKVR